MLQILGERKLTSPGIVRHGVCGRVVSGSVVIFRELHFGKVYKGFLGIVFMGFRHLENALQELPDRCMEKYLDVRGKLQEPTKTVLGYTLDIASYLNSINLGKDYTLFGGYAVLSHIMEELGEDVSVMWRGSDDIDMSGTMGVLNALRSSYIILGDRKSPNLIDKRTLKISRELEKTCKVDFYLDEKQERFSPTDINTHFGVGLRVACPLTLIRSKLVTPEGERIHAIDILKMLAVLERKGYDPRDVSIKLPLEERLKLITRIQFGLREIGEDRMGFFPSANFQRDLMEMLKKGRFCQS